MKQLFYQCMLVFAMASVLLQGCKPDVDKPAIENCLVTKIDGLEIIPATINNQNAPQVISISTAFTYDDSKRPIIFSYYTNSALTGFTKVSYNADGTLNTGTDYNDKDSITGTKEYLYNKTNQLIQQSSYNTDTIITDFTNYEYNAQGMVSLTTTTEADYDNLTFNTYSYRYVYDANNNLTKRYIRYLSRKYVYSPDFLTVLASDLKKAPEVLTTALSGYDDKFNPYRSQSTLAILFDNLPAFNNAKQATYYYRDSGDKYADITYSYEYNRKGFPYIYTTTVNYTKEYKTATGIQDYTNTSSYEYQCN